MKVEIKLDTSCDEPRVIILTDRMTEEVNDIVKKLSESTPKVITGFTEETAQIIDPSDIVKVYSGGGKVYVVTDKGEFSLRIRLYEAEERLAAYDFVRISNSEIINLKMIKNFDLSFAGTICVSLKDNSVSYVSRRYVSKIKKMLGI